MKNIGITTRFYNNENYGGVLQAYALTKVLSKMKFNVEQILIKQEFKKGSIQDKPSITKKILNVCKNPKIISNKIFQFVLENKLTQRSIAFERFIDCVPHSEKVYTSSNIKENLNKYDIFITGSDQVWTMQWYNSSYFLDFVPRDKIKISYAASMPDVNISNKEKEIVKNHLESFDAISVREINTSTFLEKLTEKKVECVLDPTFLLDKTDWNEICSDEIMYEKYIFCYFLGEDIKQRKIAKEFAKKFKLKIVTLPHLHSIKRSDILFKVHKLYGVSPQMFISLIKNAEYVLTDSFHAAVFSTIFKTKYYVFERDGEIDMSTRISTLLKITNASERYLENNKSTIDYMLSIKDMEVGDPSDEFKAMRHKSFEFLRKNIDRKG